MPYIGNAVITGDNAGNFRTLDNIKSYVNTFDSSKADVVSAANDTLTFESVKKHNCKIIFQKKMDMVVLFHKEYF